MKATEYVGRKKTPSEPVDVHEKRRLGKSIYQGYPEEVA